MCTIAYTWHSEENVQELIPPFHHVSPGDQLGLSFGSKWLYPLNHLNGSDFLNIQLYPHVLLLFDEESDK